MTFLDKKKIILLIFFSAMLSGCGELYLAAAKKDREKRDYQSAQKAIDKALESDSTNTEALYLSVLNLQALSNGSRFLAYSIDYETKLAEAIVKAGQYPNSHSLEIAEIKSKLYKKLCRTDKVESLVLATIVNPHDPEAYTQLGGFYWRHTDTLEAGTNYLKSLQEGLSNSKIWYASKVVALAFYKRSNNAFMAHDTKRAYNLYDSAIDYISRCSIHDKRELYVNFGNSYFDAGNYYCSIISYRKAIELDSNYSYYSSLAIALREYARSVPLGKEKDANLNESASILKNLIDKEDDNYTLYDELKQVYIIMSDSIQLNALINKESSKKHEKEIARQAEEISRRKAREEKARTEALASQRDQNKTPIPEAKYATDYWMFRHGQQYSGWINESSYCRYDKKNGLFRIITPRTISDEWSVVSIFEQNTQHMVAAVEYVHYKNDGQDVLQSSRGKKLFDLAVLFGTTLMFPQDVSEIENTAYKIASIHNDENGIPHIATLYNWDRDFLDGSAKTSRLNIAVFDISKEESEIAFWFDSKFITPTH